jgi:hypothetical protein
MKSLEMEFNTIIQKEDFRSRTLSRSNLARLYVGRSPINDAVLVAELFGEVFP